LAVVSSEIEQVIEFFKMRHEAERMLPRSFAMSPTGGNSFRVERIELGSEFLN
jgi:hypothetical protein